MTHIARVSDAQSIEMLNLLLSNLEIRLGLWVLIRRTECLVDLSSISLSALGLVRCLLT